MNGMMLIGGLMSAACFIGSWLAPEYSVAWTVNMFFSATLFAEGYSRKD